MKNIAEKFRSALCDPWKLKKMSFGSLNKSDADGGKGLSHAHDSYELRAFYPLHGDEFTVENVQIEIVPSHSVHCTVDSNKDHFFVGAGGGAAMVLHLDEIFIIEEDYYIEKLNEKFFNSYEEILKTLYAGLTSGGQSTYSVNLFSCLFAGIFEVFDSWKLAPYRKISAPARALAYIKHNYHNPNMNVGSVAAFVQLNPSYLSTMFTAEYGKSIISSISDIRLRRAHELLQSNRHSIKEVALLTGWSNQLYFSSRYRKRYGISPSQSRKKLL